VSLAISFFFMWAISGAGQPQYMVRLMAFKNARTLRYAIITVTVYYSLIYIPLVLIFVCARVLLPGVENADQIMPMMAVFLTKGAGVNWLAGLLIAAPFAAVMSTVDSYLLVVSSSLVRDIYQRNLSPDASERTMRWLSYLATLLVGGIAMAGAINPPRFLQDIIVYTGSGLAACFLFPMVAALYWPRANLAGCLSGMLGGFGIHLALHIAGRFTNGEFVQPYLLFGYSPVVIGLLTSLCCVVLVTGLTPPPPEQLVRRYFYQ
jgi:SSS family solute:Na+ symporter/sodium/pantothenate symporter